MMTIWKIIPRDWNMIGSQGPYEPRQLIFLWKQKEKKGQ